MRVVYTDSPWVLGPDGRPDPALAEMECSVLGPNVRLDLGLFDGTGFVTSGRDLHRYVRGADALVVYRCRVSPELVDALAPTCRVIARSGVGIDNLDASLLAKSGIFAFNVPDYCVDEVSTHTLALLLALERRVTTQDRLVKANQWRIHGGGVPRRAATCTAGIVGIGRIGRATARKLQAFYSRVYAYDPYVAGDLMAGYGVQRVDNLTELLGGCDAVVLHAALTLGSRHIIGPRALENVKPGCLLVNTARGGLVEASAVLGALEDGRLSGYASDVFEPEDPNASPVGRALLGRDDVVFSSHRAFLSRESEMSLRRRVAAGVAEVLRTGEPPAEGRVA